jgi:hypothetical protein
LPSIVPASAFFVEEFGGKWLAEKNAEQLGIQNSPE